MTTRPYARRYRTTDIVARVTGDAAETQPTGRRIDRRHTARVILIDPDRRVLLIEDSDPGLPSRPTFWITAGGALDPGEFVLDAAVREVREETGLRLAASDIRGPVAERFIVHGYSDRIVEQTETFFVAQVPYFEVDQSGLMPDELDTQLGFQWWTPHELARTAETIWPVDLVKLIDAADDESQWPVPMSTAEESTVRAE